MRSPRNPTCTILANQHHLKFTHSTAVKAASVKAMYRCEPIIVCEVSLYPTFEMSAFSSDMESLAAFRFGALNYCDSPRSIGVQGLILLHSATLEANQHE